MIHLHILGGSGRIGSALTHFLNDHSRPEIKRVTIYCDSTKTKNITNSNPDLHFDAKPYSGFSIRSSSQDQGSSQFRHVVLNLRGTNAKIDWLNNPQDSLALHTQSCQTIVHSDLWMQGKVEIIHFSSQLCDLIEGPNRLSEICQGQESYRRPYLVSRLHQEAMLSAFAFQHAIPTTFIRLAAVYGFQDDQQSPWVLNNLIRQFRQTGKFDIRNPGNYIYLTHRDALLSFVLSLVVNSLIAKRTQTLCYLHAPMLKMKVSDLAELILKIHSNQAGLDREFFVSNFVDPSLAQSKDQELNFQLLEKTISKLLDHD